MDKVKAAARHKGYKSTPERQYSYLAREAKRFDFDVMTLDEFKRMRASNCHYCDHPLPPTGYCVDRKDGSKGYTFDNTVPCCPICNFTKTTVWSYDEYIQIGKVVNQLLDERKTNGVASRYPRGKRTHEDI